MRISVGIDPSLTVTAVALWPQDIVTLHTSPPKGPQLNSRIDRYCDLTASVLDELRLPVDDAIEVACIEGYSMHAMGSAVSSLIEYGWELRRMLYRHARLVVEVPPTSLKKFVTGKGNADKLLMATTIQSRYGKVFSSYDEYDAFGLAQIAACLAGIVEPTNDAQRDVLTKLREGPQPKKRKAKS